MAEETRILTDLKDLVQAPPPEAVATEVQEPERRIDPLGRAYATGKRKNAVARVWLKPGSGRITVNGRESEVYFARPALRMIINQPFAAAGRVDQYDIWCTVRGGGLSGAGGRAAPWHQPCAHLPRARPARRAQGRRLSYPRCARGRAQEVRQAQGAPQLPVLQAIGARPGRCATASRRRKYYPWRGRCSARLRADRPPGAPSIFGNAYGHLGKQGPRRHSRR